ncbi:hypothetical protein JKP88DRAFT_262905 [Tribonema minus]|uniref:C2H2-type domain-containing protein n=1 Tax=Tribonema minus TaxID=303371 RepID=A0A835YYJ7_9STRA|nr:hypothetical protein JKP88DRAFT_262905 [Tribonema minus]
MLKHTDEKNFRCSEPDCDFATCIKGNLVRHMRTHSGERPFACPMEDCGYTSASTDTLKTHMYTHNADSKPFRCQEEDCSFASVHQQDLDEHMNTHTGAKPFHCTEADCDFKCAQKAGLERHLLTHTGVKMFQCTYCSSSFARGDVLKIHIRTHTGERPYACSYPECPYTCAQKATLDIHEFRHTGLKPFICSEENCEYSAAYAGTLKAHIQCWHTKEGKAKKITKQDRVRQILEEVYAVDSECHIKYRNGCVPDPDKHYARIDFHIVGITHTIVIVECDEGGHADYMLTCELSRMEQIHEAILKACPDGAPPVLFVRYNPDMRTIDGTPQATKRREKESELMTFLSDVAEGNVVFTETLNIAYLGYDMEGCVPCVCNDPDFPEQMKGCVHLFAP